MKRRLAAAREPVWPEGGGWEFGIERETLSETLAYWQDGFDWRAVEARLNAWPQFRTEIDGIPVHFIHTRNADPDAPALILTHGWPGSVLEFLDALPGAGGAGACGGAASAGLRLFLADKPPGLFARGGGALAPADGSARLRTVRGAGRRLGARW